jgi:hypothetical protein
MMKKIIAASLVAALIQVQYLPYLNAQSPTTQNPEAARAKEKVEKWGVGKKITVNMLDGSSYKGPITRIAADDFGIFDQARSRDVPAGYAAVKSVKAPHSALFKTLVVLGVILAIFAIACSASEDQCGDSR